MKILLAGGGTLGSVNPLIAIYEEAKKQGKDWDWFWVGTRHGIERHIVAKLGITYEWVPAAKLRRYVSLRTLIDPVFFALAFLRSLLIIMTAKPDVIMGAGSFVSVPIIWAGWLLRKKIIIHQQDVRPTLSNRLCARAARRITVSFKISLKDFPSEKSEWTGNPVRPGVLSAGTHHADHNFNLDENLPVILVTGGSSGAAALNTWVWRHLDELVAAANVIHLTGRGKADQTRTHARYCQREFLGADMLYALSRADIVIARGGISTITELAHFKKAAVIVPMPGTHQEDNALYLARERGAVMLRQDQLDEQAVRQVLALLSAAPEREKLGETLNSLMKQGARQRLVEIIGSYGHT